MTSVRSPRRLFWTLPLVVAIAVSAALKTEPGGPSAISPEAEFRNPPKAFRPAPFWAWNGSIETKELERQIDQFDRQGFGGFFIHARSGLETEYLGREWLDRFGDAVRFSRERGLSTWIYDDERWPSGSAGGRASAAYPDSRVRGMAFESIELEDLPKWLADPETLAVFDRATGKRIDHDQATSHRRRELLRFFVSAPEASNWYNGGSYLDLLDPTAVRHFLELTFVAAYDRRARSDYGSSVAGVFTDEPNVRPQRGSGGAPFPWSPSLLARFERDRGYSLSERLPSLALPHPGFEQVRYDYWRTVAEQFESSFLRPYASAMHARGLELTGHFLAEERPWRATQVVGSLALGYSHLDIPGIDHLGIRLADDVALARVTSVARQFEKPRVLSEIWGSSGQGLTLEEMKWIADHQLAHGINFLCPHMTLYSIAGPAKRDHPPTISDHQPYWPYVGRLNDYLARAAYFVSLGRPAQQILVVEPTGSVWANWTPNPSSDTVRRIEHGLSETVRALTSHQFAFDLGDELLMERFSSVESGRLRLGPGGSYRTVVLPPATRWSASTQRLLERLLAAGGSVVLAGSQPEPMASALHARGAVRISTASADLARELALRSRRPITVVDDSDRPVPEIQLHHRAGVAGTDYFLLANRDRERGRTVRLRFDEPRRVEQWQLETGEIERLEATALWLPPAGSAAIRSLPRDLKTPDPGAGIEPQKLPRTRTTRLEGPFEFRREQPAVLVLDRARSSLAKGSWTAPQPIASVRTQVRSLGGLGPHEELQPWALRWKGIETRGPVSVALELEVVSELDRPRAALVVETGEAFRLRVNGKVADEPRGWHWDRTFRVFDLAGELRSGANRLLLDTSYRQGVEIENCYLVGDFALRTESDGGFVLVAEPSRLSAGPWTTQGYPFYVGTMTYSIPIDRRPGERVMIELERPRGALFELRSNTTAVAARAWQPWSFELPPGIQSEPEMVELAVVSTLENAFGPVRSSRLRRPRSSWRFPPSIFEASEPLGSELHLEPYGIGAVVVHYHSRTVTP